MKLNDVKTLLKEMIKTKTQVTPMLWGQHGIGKSSIVREAAKEMGYKVYNLILSQKEAVDVAGILYTFEDKDLNMSVTSAHPPEWFASALKEGKTVIFLDEFNMARREVLNAAFELVLDRRLNNKRLPDDVFVVCAGNPDDERYDVTPLSESLRDRLMHIKVEHDVKGWLKWGKTQNTLPDEVIRFIEAQPRAAYTHDALDEKFPVEIKHSERSWERVGVIHGLNLPMHIKAECFRGIVGLELAQAFIKTLDKTNLPVTVEEVLAGDKSALTKAKGYVEKSPMRVDLLAQTIDNLIIHFSETKPTDKEAENVIKFISILPGDLSSRAIEGLVELSGWVKHFEKSSELESKMDSISKVKSVSKKV